MKEQAIETARSFTGHPKLAVLREYVQAEILFSLQNRNAFRRIAFVGGTALRFLHRIGRYSEDLDFSAIGAKKFDPSPLWKRVASDLRDAGYQISVHQRNRAAVSGVFFKFEGLLAEAGLSPHKKEKLSVRVEVDLRPPKGAGFETTLVRRHFFLALRHHDLPSLFAGKCHALLQRRYTKGRDLYDLAWYLTRPGLAPNLPFLANALRQTGWTSPLPTDKDWRDVLARRIQSLDWKKVSDELAHFLENPREAQTIQKDSILHLLSAGE